MRRALSLGIAFACIGCGALAEEASVFGGGGLNLKVRNLSFAPYVVSPGWKGTGKTSSGMSTNVAGDAMFSIDMPLLKGRFDGALRTGIARDGFLSARWELSPSTNMFVEECSIRTQLPVPMYAGGRVLADGRSFALPRKEADSKIVFSGKASRLEFFNAGGDPTLTLAFPKSRDILIQDSRAYKCPWFELRMKMGRSHLPSSTDVLEMAVVLPDGEPVDLNPPARYVAEASEKWRPVRKASEILPGSAADFTAVRGDSGVPAGRHGCLVAKDGHFEFENLPGVRQRFYGVNLAYKACFPERDEAERLATMLAAYGYNSVRIHHYDNGGLVGEDGTAPIPEMQRKMDGLVDACVRHGLYLTTDLLCLRNVPNRLAGIDAPGNVDDYRWMVFFHDGVFSNHVQFVKSLLNHRNVYTGRRYAEEPAFALLSLVNEGLLTHRKTPAAGTMAYRITAPIWRKWIAERQGRGEFTEAPLDFPASVAAENYTSPVALALQSFCALFEDRFAARMRHVVRDELGCKALLTSLNSGVPPVAYDEMRKRNFDYCDTHYYWDHPRFLSKGWGLPTEADHFCVNPVCTPNLGRRVGGVRFHGQPQTVTELNFCPPSPYRSLYGLLVGGNAAFDDWGGVWRFCWGCSKGGIGMPSKQTVGWFDVAGDVTALSAERAVAALFLRGDLEVGKGKYGAGKDFAIERFSGAVTVNTPRTSGGFRERGRMVAGALAADFGHDSGAVWATSLSDAPISQSRRILLTHLTDGMDTGTVFRDGRRTIVEKWGHEPHLLRLGRVDVALRLAEGAWTVFALDATGARRKRVDAHYSDGWLKFVADVSMRPDDATFLYEIVADDEGQSVSTAAAGSALWIEAEDFSKRGGWVIDTQFVHKMGSAYLLAASAGNRVSDAVTEFEIPAAGKWRCWARTRDWSPDFSPGKFCISVDGVESRVLGACGKSGWLWEMAGEFQISAGRHELRLVDKSGYFGRCDAIVMTTDADYFPPHEIASIDAERARLGGDDASIADGGEYDVAVIGGGPAGMGAAVAAARSGAKTVLVHDRSVLGGNASSEFGVRIHGASYVHPNSREGGLLEEARLLMLKLGPKANMSDAFREQAKGEANLSVQLMKRVVGVEKEKRKIVAVLAKDTMTGKRTCYRAKMFVDCTGDGWVGYYAGVPYRKGREGAGEFGEAEAPERPDARTMSGVLMADGVWCFQRRDAGREVKYVTPEWARVLPNGFSRKLKPLARGAGGFGPAWWIEHSGDIDDFEDPEAARDMLVKISFAYWGWGKNEWEHRDVLRNEELVWVPYKDARRETLRLTGAYIMTANDEKSARMFDDRISYGGWPMDTHDPLGMANPNGNGFWKHHPDLPVYSIPYRVLYAPDLDNFFFAGRCQSATHMALGSIRVMATVSTLGQACGTAAAECVRLGTTPEEYGTSHVAELQQRLLRDDQYIPQVRNEDPADVARTARVTASSSQGRFYFRESASVLRHKTGFANKRDPSRPGWLYAENAAPERVLDGVSRIVGDEAHGWASDESCPMPQWLRLDFPKPTSVSQIRIAFNSDFMPTAPAAPMPATLAKGYFVEVLSGGEWRKVAEAQENARRLCIHDFRAQTAEALRITVTETYGSPSASIFEIRAY